MQLSLTTQTGKVAQGNYVLHRREAVAFRQMVCMFYIKYMYVCTHLTGDVGGDRVGGAVFGGRRLVVEGLKGEIFFVLEALDTAVCVHLDLLGTGLCSLERAGSCVSSCAQLQWVTWREVDTEVSEGTYCTV